ncbi:lysozyme inhibitor LprI family protein [Acidicapsa acidisoli]|uniref:lysozyme inhibitor LprI family protein n=1 Tax=Acidicapsa acidisoli TaxID=1615681 RepID=UPI0021E0641E|nr:lysozyme inhibitor LprI family protein [Acidicapsa acidisoli]
MHSFPGSKRRSKVISSLFLMALLLAVDVTLPGKAAALDAGGKSQDMPEAAPPPAAFQNPIPTDQLAFLNEYYGKSAKDVVRDKRFRKLMKEMTPRTTYHYGRDMPLSEASGDVMDGAPLPVVIHDGRYVMIATHGGPYLSGRGFVWFDMQKGIALGGVYFHPVNGEPTPTLAVFSRQLYETSLNMSQLPLAFAQDLSEWIQHAGLRFISPRYFIPENGKKYVLVHDEDYCDHPANAPAPPQDACQQLNAEAAEADLNAADFMAQTHNAANATAWMLSPALVSWIGFRNQSCGAGPYGVNCRIRMTRQRARLILVQQRR